MSLWYIIIDRKYESKQLTLRVNCSGRKDASWLDTSARKRRTRIDDQTCQVEIDKRELIVGHVQ